MREEGGKSVDKGGRDTIDNIGEVIIKNYEFMMAMNIGFV